MLRKNNFEKLYEVIIAKSEGYGFYVGALKLIHNYLTNREQNLKVNDPYSSLKDIFYGVLQESILGLLLFLLLSDLLYFLEE